MNLELSLLDELLNKEEKYENSFISDLLNKKRKTIFELNKSLI